MPDGAVVGRADGGTEDQTVTGQIEVTGGKMTLAFYLEADQEANLQIDDVSIERIR